MTFQLFFAALLALLLGLAFSLWGYRVFLVMLPVWGFVAGFWLGAETFSLLFGDGFLATTASWVVGLILGIVGGIFSYLFYWIGVIFVAAALGAGLGASLMQALGINANILVLTVAIIVGVLAAFLAWRHNLQRYVVIALTALVGANLLVLAPLLLFGQVTLGEVRAVGDGIVPVIGEGALWTLLWLALAIGGFVFQMRKHGDFYFGKADYVEGWG